MNRGRPCSTAASHSRCPSHHTVTTQGPRHARGRGRQRQGLAGTLRGLPGRHRGLHAGAQPRLRPRRVPRGPQEAVQVRPTCHRVLLCCRNAVPLYCCTKFCAGGRPSLARGSSRQPLPTQPSPLWPHQPHPLIPTNALSCLPTVRLAGVEGRSMAFLLPEQHILSEAFVEDVSNMLSRWGPGTREPTAGACARRLVHIG